MIKFNKFLLTTSPIKSKTFMTRPTSDMNIDFEIISFAVFVDGSESISEELQRDKSGTEID